MSATAHVIPASRAGLASVVLVDASTGKTQPIANMGITQVTGAGPPPPTGANIRVIVMA